jgi:hypothetical protein
MAVRASGKKKAAESGAPSLLCRFSPRFPDQVLGLHFGVTFQLLRRMWRCRAKLLPAEQPA